ncbi:MAG TPA: PAS domain S-box protein [Verrucomicrobiae bacterium]|nr:PAS domain S-box protein [Verrucomicrobiae bacterium]
MRLELSSRRHEKDIERPQGDEGPHDALSFIHNSVPALLSYIDAECRYRACNRAYSEWFSLPRDKVIGHTMREVLGDEAWATLQPHVQEVIAGHQTQFELEAKYRRGGTRWIRVCYTPDLDDHGRVLGFAVLVTDISDHKKAEDALRQSEQFARTIIESSRDCLKIVSLDGILLWMSDAGQKLLCIDDIKAVLGKSWIDFWQGEDRANATKAVEAAACGGSETFVGLFPVCNQPRWWEVVVSPIRDLSGKPEKLLVVSRDVTERKRTDEALREREALLQKAMSARTVGVLFFVLNGRMTNANDTFEQMSGYTREELRNSVHWKTLTAPEFLEVTARTAESLAVTGKAPPYEKQMIRKNGSRWWGLFAPTRLSGSGPDSECMEFIIDITERKQAEEALRDSEARLRLFIQHAPAGIAMFDRDMRYLAVSNRWKRDYGLKGEVLGRSHYELYPEIPKHWKEAHRRALAGEVLRAEEEAFHRADGSTQWVKWEVRPWYSAKGAIGGILMAAEEITARVRANSALQESERRFRSFVEATAHVIWRTNARGEVDQPIPSWNAFTGQTDQEAAGFGWMNAIHPDDRPKVAAAWQKASATKGTYEVKYLLKIKSGEWRHIRARGVPVFDAAGNIVEYIGTCMDVTERRLAEERFEQLAENIPQLAWMTNADGWIFWYNKRWYEYTGTTLEQMHGWGWQAVHHPDHTERVSASWQRALKTGEPWEETFPLRGKDGNYRWFLSGAFPIRDANGRIVRWFGTNTDITESRDAQHALEKAQQELRFHAENLERMVAERTTALRESNDQMEAFTYTIAHDLRAPLRGQQGFAHALLDEHAAALGETGREYAERIIQSAARMDNLISDLLAYSRLSRTAMRMEKIDLRKLVLEICDELTFQIRDARATVHVDPFYFVVCGHQITLRTSIQNLVANALKFTRPGVPPEIRIRAEERGKFVRLWVEDNGIGIAPEHHHQIFGVFHRLHRIGQYPGTGVGLAIVQKGIERMGGRVGVESEEGVGSRFWIELETPD